MEGEVRVLGQKQDEALTYGARAAQDSCCDVRAVKMMAGRFA